MTFAAIARMIGIKGGVIIALCLALAFSMWRTDVWQDRAEDYAQAVANEKAAHAVTRASLANLEQRNAAYIADGERRTKAAAEALRAQEARSAALGEQIARIRVARPTPAEIERCETPGAVRRAEGL